MASGQSYDVSELEAGDNTTVHGHILKLSPIKTSKNKPDCSYFNGKLSDGVKVARFAVSVHARQQSLKIFDVYFVYV